MVVSVVFGVWPQAALPGNSLVVTKMSRRVSPVAASACRMPSPTHYRLLMEPVGAMLRSLIRYDSHAALVARAIARIRRDFSSEIVIADLAREVGMSVSSFHRHFKAVTSLSPLQYQKELRLLEARRLLMTGAPSVSTTGFDVGYESLSQFSREYARKFGRSPAHDLARGSAAIG